MENMDKVEIRCAECGSLIATITEEEREAFLDAHGNGWYTLCDNNIVLYEGEFYCDECQEGFEECVECSELLDTNNGEGHYVSGEGYFCQDCTDHYLHFCERCNNYVRNESTKLVYTEDGRGIWVEVDWCDECVDRHAWRCSHCGDWFDDDIECFCTTSGDYICDNCRADHFYRCDECGEYVYEDDVHSDDSNYYCEACWEERDQDVVIYDYHHYPNEWEFRNHNHLKVDDAIRRKYLHCGLELEIDRGGQDENNAVQITTAMGYPADESHEFKCSRDGSLRSGFEIISMPATLEYHLKKYKWEAGMAEALKLGYQSHDANTCGLHCHFDREYFHGSMVNPEEGFVIIITNNINWLKKFSRRTDYGYCAFMNAEPFTTDDFKQTEPENQRLTQIKLDSLRSYYNGHGSALNFNNHGTIEARFVRGTLKYSTFTASLQLMEMLGYAVKHFRKEQLVNIDLKWFKRFAVRKGYAEFNAYLAERGIMS